MDRLAGTFAEDPTYLYAALGIAAFVFLAVWYERRERRWLWMLFLTADLALAVFLIERVIVTDRERIAAALQDIRQCVAAQDLDRAAQYIDENYGGWKLTRRAVIAAGKIALRQYDVKEVRFVGEPAIEFRGSARADCNLRTVVHRGGEVLAPAVPMSWKLEWIKRDAGWRIRRAQPSFDPLP